MAKQDDPWRTVRGAWTLYNALEQINANARSRAAEARAIHAEQRMLESLDEARRVRQFIEREEASDKLGAGRIGSLADAARLNMLDPEGIFLGALDGHPLFYNGTGPILNYGPTQTGKGRDLVLTNAAHVRNRSMVFNDIKNGENAYASAGHRRRNLGHRTIPLNPHGLLGVPSFRYNPFQRIIDRAQAGKSVQIEALQAAMSLAPTKESGDAWVAAGAQDMIALLIEHRARFMPERCTPSELWRFGFGDTAAQLRDIARCGAETLETLAEGMVRYFEDAPEQWSAYTSELKTAGRSFRPGEPLALVTEASDFDPASMRRELTTVYLMSAENQIEASARWISLTIGALLETLANTPGPVPVLFVIDELANLPYMPAIPKALTLYAGLGIQLFALCQGRSSLAARGYSEATIKVFEEQAGVFSMWGVEDTSLLRDVEAWSGKMGVAIRGVNNSGGQVASASFGLTEHARPVLQAEDIRAVHQGRQILRVSGNHLFVADRVPWFTVPRWRDALRDVRTLHHAVSAPPTPAMPPAPPPVRRITHQPLRPSREA
ncbi:MULTISPECIES: type IV secretory system conjugative DNA transfer family protein [Methylorubrum]|uniref:type IV secretory system conjugative DNA transfer family protein n=1 Tax=Methylorubrum TaxID=2282523 RepID=UPI00209DCBF3|nr:MULTISPECIES: type IV secretory system conjugative DNA transfer family protein [Methylorubrum]MCP1551673.1 type IV secretion system protein VirD4 [Methylorubrum zatmanii]MCP1556632.1 type IV secretion system protein VirD4 [Methylorubrum extorquens]MCP1581751.1 type IV secretion system protein VirD4 [Methylorubrum extorquens]